MQATLRALLGRTASLPDLATLASELLYAATSPEKYVTAALAELSPESGAVNFVGAGHLDNVILRPDGTAVSLASTGTPLGLLPSGLPYLETAHQLAPGDYLVLFSDGVTDAENQQGEEFGESRLLEVLRADASRSGEALIDDVFAAIDRFAGRAPQFDDITLLVVRRLP
jgi:sigma-B regulation protein RsbU (phosphoserine phosphatase)